MATTWEGIQEEFALFGTTFADDVLPELCVNVCKRHGWEPSDLYDQWIAWAKGKSTLVEMETFEKMVQDFEKKKQAAPPPPPAQRTPKPAAHKRASTQGSPAVIGTPKRRLEGSASNALSASFTDGSDSTPARMYKSGKRTGQIVASYVGKSFRDAKRAEKIDIKILNDMAMNGRLQNKNRNELNIATLERLGCVKDTFKLPEDSHLASIGGGVVSHGDLVYGMLRPPRKANLPFMLYGDYETSRSASMPVLTKFPSFPGQVIAARVGNSAAGQAHFLDASLPPTIPPLPAQRTNTEGRLRIVVAAGPYTTLDTLSYEPYYDFVERLATDEPDVAILFGPFVDRNHRKLSTNLDCSFEAYFRQLIGHLAQRLTGKRTRVFIVANSRENHTTCRAFPTEKYACLQRAADDDGVGVNEFPNITALNDPAIVQVNGIQLALSSTDVFRALRDSLVNVSDCDDNNQENGGDGGGDVNRMSARLLLEQRSFYPVFPPPGDLIVRLPLNNKVMFVDERPHIFIMPATVAPFAFAEHDSVFVNPGSLVKGLDAGSYGYVDIGVAPPHKDNNDTAATATVANVTKVAVVRI